MDLTTERLLMRPFKAADITESYLSWLKDPVVTRFSNQRFRQHTMKSCTAYQRSFNESDNSFLLLIHREDAIPIGTLTIYRAHQHGTADIGLMLGNKAYWRKGLGLEAWTSALEAVLKEKGLRKVTAGAARTNTSMVKIMEQSGMSLEAVRQRQEMIEGQAVDLLYYARFTAELA